MAKTLAVVVSLLLAACMVGSEDDASTGGAGTDGGGGTGGGGGGGGGGGSSGITGNITQDTTWQGSVLIGGITTIQTGVTVTVAAGTTITVKSVGQLVVQGVLDVQGTGAAKVTIRPEMAAFQGVTVSPGGQLTYAHVEQTGGGIFTLGTGKATIVDSRMSHASGDYLMMNGGTLDVQYSWIGVEAGQTDTTHCNMHFGGSGNVIKVTHSNVSTSSYGLMFYGGTGADFTHDNWFANSVDVDVMASSPVTGTFSSGWFEKGAPTGSGITAANLAGARLPACDGTNDATCAGPRP